MRPWRHHKFKIPVRIGPKRPTPYKWVTTRLANKNLIKPCPQKARKQLHRGGRFRRQTALVIDKQRCSKAEKNYHSNARRKIKIWLQKWGHKLADSSREWRTKWSQQMQNQKTKTCPKSVFQTRRPRKSREHINWRAFAVHGWISPRVLECELRNLCKRQEIWQTCKQKDDVLPENWNSLRVI